MKFHEWTTSYEESKDIPSLSRLPLESWQTYYTFMIDNLQKLPLSPMRMAEFRMEANWYSEMRPYYKIWPSIIPELTKVRIDTQLDQLRLSNNVISLRLPEFTRVGGVTLRSVLLMDARTQSEQDNSVFVRVLLVMSQYEDANGILIEEDAIAIPTSSETFEDRIAKIKSFSGGGSKELLQFVARLAVAVLLLADDPSIIEPDVLSKDERAYERTKDQKYVDKAHRRGKVGWHIGKTFESIPHYRRPHPALFHTGKGRTVPRIVFRSGCVVHRDKMTKVPTGYITPEGMEVEPK